MAQYEVVPLYARLAASEQNKILPHSGQRIILATNMAETSLTVLGSGMLLIRLCENLDMVIVPKCNDYRKRFSGFCSTTSRTLWWCRPSYSIILARRFSCRPEFDPRYWTNLASVICGARPTVISIFSICTGTWSAFRQYGMRLLEELNAIVKHKRTHSPALGNNWLNYQSPLCADGCLQNSPALSVWCHCCWFDVQDPREPLDKQQQIIHREFADDDSDFNALYNIYEAFSTKASLITLNCINGASFSALFKDARVARYYLPNQQVANSKFLHTGEQSQIIAISLCACIWLTFSCRHAW